MKNTFQNFVCTPPLHVIFLALFFCFFAFKPLDSFAQCIPLDYYIELDSPSDPAHSEFPGCDDFEVCITFAFFCNAPGVEFRNTYVGWSFPEGSFEITDIGDFTEIVDDPVSSNYLNLRDEEEFKIDDIKTYCFRVRPTIFGGAGSVMTTIFFRDVETDGIGNAYEWQWTYDQMYSATGLLTERITEQDMLTVNQACSATTTQNWYVESQFNINTSYCLKGQNVRSRVKFAPGASITISNNSTFTVENADFSACSDMWEQIKVESGSTLIIKNSTISDGYYGINAESGSTISLEDVIFTNNYVGLLSNGGPVNVLQFDGNSFSAPELKPPYGGTGIAAIWLNNMLDIQLVGTGNTMSELDNGLIAWDSKFTLSGCSISDLFENGSLSSFGVYARSFGFPKDMTVEDNSISTCRTAIEADRMMATITGNTISSVVNGFHGINRSRAWISENSISTSGHGIRADDMTILSVFENSVIKATGAQGLEDLSNAVRIEAPGTTFAAINDNDEIRATNARNAIVMNSGNLLRAEQNTVYNTYEYGFGINMQGIGQIDLYCNGVQGSGGSNRGIYDNDSRGEVKCNLTTGSGTGIEFNGMPVKVSFLGNSMVGHEHNGLHINAGGTAIGNQPHHGNQWFGDSDATHSGQNVFASRFWVHTNNPPYHPQLDVPSGNPLDWFVTEESEPFDCEDFTCGAGFDFPDPPVIVWECEDGFTTLEVAIADSSFYTEDVTDGNWWNARKRLLEKIRIPCTGTPPVMPESVEAFETVHEESELGKLLDVQLGIEAMNDPAATELEEIRDIQQSKDAEIANWKDITDQLANENLTQQERAALLAQQETSLETINEYDSEQVTEWNSYKQDRYQTAAQLLAQNNSITVSDTPAENEKWVNAIYLRSLAVDSTGFTEGQLDTLFDIASQCPKDGGDAVHRARAMYAYAEPGAYFSEDDCESEFQGKIIGSSVNGRLNEFTLVPNPVQTELYLTLPKELVYTGEIQVLNALGQQILQHKTEVGDTLVKLNVSDMKEGIYFIRLIEGKTQLGVQKFFIIR